MKTLKIKTSKNKIAIISIATLLMISMVASMALSPNALAQVHFPVNTQIPTYAQINVAPNPVGIGQTVTVDMYLAVPLETSERVQNMTLYITDPNGVKTTYGPFTSDATGGTYYAFAPSVLGNYSIYWYYPGQNLTGTPYPNGWGGLLAQASTSPTIALMVQQEPVARSYYPITPLPTSWWETPVTAENIQNWYLINGPWMGLSALPFAACGTFNSTTVCNPWTQSVLAGHVIWTLPWGGGGVPGGEYGGTESSNFWMTRQYSPNFAPVIMNGILYSTQYTYGLSTGANNGIIAINLFTGQQLWSINTTNALRCGNMFQFKNPNQYGVVGPFLWTTGNLPKDDTGGNQIGSNPSPYMNTTGTQWNMYDAFDGRYVLSIVNGTSLSLSTDDQGNLVGYFINSTSGVERVTPGAGVRTSYVVNNTVPHLDCFNFTTAMSAGGLNYQPARNSIVNFASGLQFAVPVANNITGATINPALAINGITSNVVGLTGGFIHGQGVGGEQAGWLVVSGMDYVTGAQLMLKNVTTSDTAVMDPFTRLSYNLGAGMQFIFDGFNWKGVAYDLHTGTKLWDMQLTPVPGYQINPYDVFNFKTMYANGIEIAMGFGGDIWGVNATTGKQMWATNTISILGDPGIETPYGTWPIWVFGAQCQSSDVAYFGIGHEYDPPLFHGAQMLAINMTNGNLIWKELGYYTRAMAIAENTLISVNEYSNEVFAFAKGPSTVTVSAPNIGVTTTTPITITGMVTDASPGTEQDAIRRNYQNGVPVVSDESESLFMEHVYQQQPAPTNTTGVPITINVIDSNNNFRTIGTATSDASGTYSLIWTPDIPGDYTIIANFAGSNSYYPSFAETHIYASLPQATATATVQENIATSDLVNNLMIYVVVGVIAIIIAIAILGVLILRKHP